MSLATKSIASHRSDSGHPEAALNSSVLDRMMDAMTSPFLNGRRAESIKNGRRVHPGAFVFSLALFLLLIITSQPIFQASHTILTKGLDLYDLTNAGGYSKIECTKEHLPISADNKSI